MSGKDPELDVANNVSEVSSEALEPADPEEASQLLMTGMSEEQIDQVSRLLRAGKRLPPHLFPNLFEVPREYELSYRGKARRVDVLAETMAMPLQPVRTFGQPQDGWSNMLVLGDNLQVLRYLLVMKDAGQLVNPDGARGVRLCYIDPPFASEREFAGSRSEKAYSDLVAGAEFVEHLRRRLILIHELLTDDGSLFVHLDTRKVHYMKVVLDEIFGESGFRNEIIWKRQTAHSDITQGAKHLGRLHDTILLYCKGDGGVWNMEYTPYEEGFAADFYRYKDRKTGRRYGLSDITGPGGAAKGNPRYQFLGVTRFWRFSKERMKALYEEGRIVQSKPGVVPRQKRYLDEMKGVPLQDIWTDLFSVQAQGRERTGYPTQKPERLLRRIIGLASDPGDIVLDAFVGSGTTLEAAQRMDHARRWIGIDSGKFAIYVAQARLLRDTGGKPPQHAFTLYNAGLYDYSTLRDLPWSRYLDFVLDLFQCRKAQLNLGGVAFHGYIADDPVLVYDFNKHPDGRIGQPFIEDLARLCGARLGARCFIIAPASAVDFYEDYITVRDTRFFFLRIPYSIIAELHKKGFSDLRQPTSEARANAPIDSVGFDFIVPPRVECHYEASAETLDVQITAFESEAFVATESQENIANLAMVLVDYDYDGEVFDLDAVHFAEDLETGGWRFSLPRSQVGDRLLIVYVDLFGNEYREVRQPTEFHGYQGGSQRSRRPRSARRSTVPLPQSKPGATTKVGKRSAVRSG